jgi:hypothetical protein
MMTTIDEILLAPVAGFIREPPVVKAVFENKNELGNPLNVSFNHYEGALSLLVDPGHQKPLTSQAWMRKAARFTSAKTVRQTKPVVALPRSRDLQLANLDAKLET